MFKALGIIMSLMNNIRTHLVIFAPGGPSLYLIHPPAIRLTRLTPSSMDIGYRDFFSYQLAQ